MVAEWIAQPAVDAVGPLGRLLGEFHALGSKLVVGLPAIVGREEQVPASGALRNQLADLLGRLDVERRRARGLQQNLAWIAGNVHREPTHEAQVLVGIDLETEFADVEIERLVLVEHVDR